MNLNNRSSTNDLYNLALKIGLKDIIIIRKKQFNNVENQHVIMNLDDINNGSHWIYANKKYKIYFDSYNQHPPNIIPNDYKQANSKFEIQSLNSDFCGQLCVLFAYFLEKNKNPNKGIKEFYSKFKDVYSN